MLTSQMISEIDAAVRRVALSVGFGEVTIVIEKRRPVRLRESIDRWLDREHPPPKDQPATAKQ